MKTIKCYDLTDLIREKLFGAEIVGTGEFLEYVK